MGRLFTVIVGMNIFDYWKRQKVKVKQNKFQYIIVQFADILDMEFIENAKRFEEEHLQTRSGVPILVLVNCGVKMPTSEELVMTSHSKEYLKGSQVRCIWYSRFDLIERKATMKCLECNRVFCCDDTGLGFWCHHVALGGFLRAPKWGTKKHKPNNEEMS